MKKKIWISVLVIVILAGLFIPIPRATYDDGGTREYTALTYKIVDWNRIYDDGGDGLLLYKKTRVYFGEDRWQDIKHLWLRESETIEHDFLAVIREIDGSLVTVEALSGEPEAEISLNIEFFSENLPDINAEVGNIVEIRYVGNVPWTSLVRINAKDWKRLDNIKEELMSADIYKCDDDVYITDDTPKYGSGTISLIMPDDVFEVKSFKLLRCYEACDFTDVVSRASQGYAPVYQVVEDGELNGNFPTFKFKMTLDENVLRDFINQGINFGIAETLEYKHYYLLVLDPGLYAYVHLEGDGNLSNPDEVIKKARVEYDFKKMELTLEKVIELSQKGEELNWSDFAEYESVEVGSGLYILHYELDETFDLLIGGVPSVEPMYMRLASDTNHNKFVDIRTDDVEAFIEQIRSQTDDDIYRLSSENISSYLVEKLDESYEWGENVIVTVDTVPETNLFLYVNNTCYTPEYSDTEYTVFQFTMPRCDTVLGIVEDRILAQSIPDATGFAEVPASCGIEGHFENTGVDHTKCVENKN